MTLGWYPLLASLAHQAQPFERRRCAGHDKGRKGAKHGRVARDRKHRAMRKALRQKLGGR